MKKPPPHIHQYKEEKGIEGTGIGSKVVCGKYGKATSCILGNFRKDTRKMRGPLFIRSESVIEFCSKTQTTKVSKGGKKMY